MKKKLNLIIDALLMILFGMLAGGGFLVYYVLLPGQEAKQIYGPFKELSFWGLDRHEWASIHLIISFVFIGMVFLHIIFHWKMVCNMTKSFIGKLSSLWIIWIIIIVTVLIAIFPFFIKPEITERESKNYGRKWNIEHQKQRYNDRTQVNQENVELKYVEQGTQSIAKAHSESKSEVKAHSDVSKKHDYSELEEQIKGSQTLAEACKILNIDADELCKKLKISASEKNERLGRIKRNYNLQMTDIKDVMIKMHVEQDGNN
jgi:uncharacterized membrane protein